MNEPGATSPDGTAPSITATTVRVAFAPDEDSLASMLQDAERRATEVIERIKNAAKQAIDEVALYTQEAMEARQVDRPATEVATSTERAPESNRPQENPVVTKLTEIQVTLDGIAANTEEIAVNTAPNG